MIGALGHLFSRYYSVFIILAVWEILPRAGLIKPFLLPPLSQVIERFFDLLINGRLIYHLSVTMFRMWSGLLIAVVIGVPLGILIGRQAWARAFFRPLLALGFPIPKLGIYPALIIIFGMLNASKILLVVADSIFPIIFSAIAGAVQVDRRLVWSAQAMGTPEDRILGKIILPAALPSILTGFRVSLVVALIAAFLSEMIASADGLGHLMMYSARLFRTTDMFVAVGLVSVLGLVFDRATLAARKHLLRWSVESELH